MALSAQDVLARYTAGIQGGGAKWLKGIQSLTVNPAQQAATPEALNAYIQGCQRSITSNKRQNALNRVSLADIQNAASSYGQANYSNSATKAAAKYSKKLPAMQALWSAQRAAAQAIPHTPGNMGSAMARVQAVIGLAMQAKGSI